MLLLFIIFVFYLMHTHFLVQNLMWGVRGAHFFNHYAPYNFSREVAVQTLVFCVSCTGAFVIGYLLSQCVLDKRLKRPCGKATSEERMSKAVWLLNVFLAAQIGLGLYVLSRAGLNYSAIFNAKISMSFLFESRMLALVLLGFVYLNKPPATWLKDRALRVTAKLLLLYFAVSLLMQSRSVVFEFGAVLGFCWLMWHGNKIKIRYVAVSLLAMCLPNLIALPRFGGGLDWREKMAGIFSFEYSVLMSNIVSCAMASDHPSFPMDLLISVPSLLIPSPVRSVLGTGITPGAGGDYYASMLEDAGVFGGGFSLIAQMYMTLGWWGISVFACLGFLIGKFIRGARKVGRVDLLYAAAPLIYAQFIISLRSDFTMFAKYSIQLLLVAMILKSILRIRGIPRARASSEGPGCQGSDSATGDWSQNAAPGCGV